MCDLGRKPQTDTRLVEIRKIYHATFTDAGRPVIRSHLGSCSLQQRE